MKKRVPFIAAIVIAAVLLAVLIFASRRTGEQKPQGGQNPPAISSLKRFVAAEGKIETEAGGQVDVGSELIGRIAKVYVKVGDEVKAGDVLASLDSKDYQARLKGSESELAVALSRLAEVRAGSRTEEIKRAQYILDGAVAEAELAKKNLLRHRDLHAKGFISEYQLEEKVSAFKVAKARVKERRQELTLLEKGPKAETLVFYEKSVEAAKAAATFNGSLLEKSVIRSPISGRVIRKLMEEGETVIPETPMLTVADVTRVRVNAEVDETDIGRIALGDEADITSDAYPGQVYKGVITEINDYVGERKVKPNNTAKNMDMKVIQVKLALKERTPLKLGMTVDVRITPGKKGR
ncbi:MAG: efflux RND transporter periplasmic adaptor subunit [Deltaproteobacteria bacterium]|nr:efflux RND transporter periplasmic adaptor subunit [Deltaproteobacteria bacterium]